MSFTFDVLGLPKPQGSKRALPTKSGRTVVVESAGQPLKDWRSDLAFAANAQLLERTRIDGPTRVTLDFRLPRPKSAPRRVVWPSRRPDVDKLARAALDGLVTGGLLADDSLVVRLTAEKRFATPEQPPGCSITIEEVSE